MIKYEFNTLVLDPSFSKDDQKSIDLFVEQRITEERDRIIMDLEAETNGYGTLSIPLFKLKRIINNKEGLSA